MIGQQPTKEVTIISTSDGTDLAFKDILQAKLFVAVSSAGVRKPRRQIKMSSPYIIFFNGKHEAVGRWAVCGNPLRDKFSGRFSISVTLVSSTYAKAVQGNHAWRGPFRQGRLFTQDKEANDLMADIDCKWVLQVGACVTLKLGEHKIQLVDKPFLLGLEL
ncbi:mll9223 (plasmid) [Mesorhizobium japonicum MAFF 303099]|uniref:Mll9223 protein n=1 Tax=Mesorhizobium japonicum (strain LMG 29417 / CECT 9101 / MAFF 303099) TaxID=266835 RepID=Q981V2_RHILO|nr:mll9223 [Mesorhizobium japonicum MAFF 303099]